MAPPEVESWRVDAPDRPCAFCRQIVEDKRCTTCPRCVAVYHPDCWVSNSRRCAVYGCEPGRKPAVVAARPVRPILQPPELPRSGVGWTWALPLLVVLAMNVGRWGWSGSSSRTSSPAWIPPKVEFGSPLPLASFMDFPEPVIPAMPDEVPALVEEAQALEDSVTGLQSLPPGRLTDDVRSLLRETVLGDLATLGRSLWIYRRCAATDLDPELRNRIDRLRLTIARRRGLLIDLMRTRPRVLD